MKVLLGTRPGRGQGRNGTCACQWPKRAGSAHPAAKTWVTSRPRILANHNVVSYCDDLRDVCPEPDGRGILTSGKWLMRNLRAALTATIDTIRMGIKLWRTAKKREREAGRQ